MKDQTQGGFLITKIHHLGGRIFAKMLKEHNIEINPGQGRILFALWQEDDITMNELARRTQLGKSTLTTMLDRLEESKHVIRYTPEGGDQRLVLVKLTQKNRDLQQTYSEVSQRMTELFYDGFSVDEISIFETYLQRILDNLIRADK